jgi:hypothetical protein
MLANLTPWMRSWRFHAREMLSRVGHAKVLPGESEEVTNPRPRAPERFGTDANKAALEEISRKIYL